MINKQVLVILFLTSICIAIARTFDFKAANGKLSPPTVTFLGFSFAFAVVITLLLITNKKVIFSEIAASRGTEIKYLILSALFVAPSFLTGYWLFTKEKSHILALFSTGFLVTMNLMAARLILKESISMPTYIGSAVVFFGLALINYYHGKNE